MRTPDEKPLLTLRNVNIEAKTDSGWSPIVRDVSLDLRRGEVLGLIGESGAGKSTLGLAAMGFARDGCRISAGEIRFDNIDLRAVSPDRLRKLRGRRIAYVAQSAAASFNPAFRLLNQFVEVPVQHGVKSSQDAKVDAIDLFTRMRLPNAETIGFRYPHQVSGGQLQRAMTAMAMSCRPDLIIFDEPTTALDVTTQIEVLAAIRDIVRNFDTAALYISHDLAVVAQMADRIKVLLKGQEVEEADAATMISSPRHDYTKSLWSVRSHQRPVQAPVASGVQPVVSVNAVTASYGDLDVLKDVTIEFHKGRTVAIVGESGSGKSTLARVISGLLPPRKGSVTYKGKPLEPYYRNRSIEQLRHVQMIYQSADTALNPKLAVSEILGRPASMYLGLKGKALRDRVNDLLRLIDLEPGKYLNRRPPELSGGQKQRIGIARALAAEPDFIICDEVTSALDEVVAEGILILLDRIQKEFELSYMFVTHDIAVVRAIADDIVVMNQGKAVEQGDRETVLSPPYHPYTQRLLNSVPEMRVDWLTEHLEARRKAGSVAFPPD